MNMANEVLLQLSGGEHSRPAWFVAGAGSGGTATSIARYLRKWADFSGSTPPARLAVVDPEDSALYGWFQSGDTNVTVAKGSRIEGIGSRGPVRFGTTFSLLREGVARMIKVPDADSVAAMHLVSRLIGQDVGPSTGTNLCGSLRLAAEMHRRGETGAIVTIICDDGSRYRENYYDAQWIRNAGLEHDRALRRLEAFWATGRWS
jgi:cysteine synthase A